jgi:hypothetical protein
VSAYPVQTPVAFFVYRRPDTTQRVFNAIANVKPTRLLVIADGPRNDEEQIVCDQTRAITEHVDWECEVLRNYADTNLGLKRRVSSGLDWVFESYDEAIILEDDCLPDPSFFSFCEALLAKYRDDHRVMHISGDQFQRNLPVSESYYFSIYAHVWGWATWRRAWSLYDVSMGKWQEPSFRNRVLRKFRRRSERNFWKNIGARTLRNEIDSWAYQWSLTCLGHDGLAINPTDNLVSNIGFGTNATHTVSSEHPLANIPTREVAFPLRHPSSILPVRSLDEKTADLFFTKPSLATKGLRRLRRSLASTLRYFFAR